ncbi:RNA polymerase sigma factor SigJ [Actinoplanes sp. NBRC 14428]|uniref:RNA polymerase sigma-70 factor (ECF subfamily) n=1 Tax=Pseudosporangium ferrugineum TaxID=439699 RepID=A0A2T0S5S9_9ACTN|nr:RNA polymerase sigma factor SigJ [Pseudosporangium ferrugineum]PRY28791.1 RNA polymerase sigma-70 factor (ECF subfamily) [Pseudosporangium ferrugineum]BCJ53748.1 RNA polymerase sigma factor SigJ [Actinoplanes sp. NBRC 14428]
MPSPDEFEVERPHLLSVAYRMLGSRAEAEDAVQEAWLRYHRSRDTEEIRDLRGWLTTITGRICLDVLKSARVRREAYPGQWLPEPVVSFDDPAERVAQRQEVSLALLVVLEKLTPEQRVAVVLHDAFAVPFEEVADVLHTSVTAARQHASRGRKAIADGQARNTAGRTEQRKVLEAFLAAATSGDLHALAAVLAPDVVTVGDGGGVVNAGRNAIVGAAKVARFWAGVLARLARETDGVVTEPVLVNGDAGVLVTGRYADGRELLSVLSVAVADGRITALYNQLNPAKLGSVTDR